MMMRLSFLSGLHLFSQQDSHLFIVLKQIVFCEVCFTCLNIIHNTIQITHIIVDKIKTLRIPFLIAEIIYLRKYFPEVIHE